MEQKRVALNKNPIQFDAEKKIPAASDEGSYYNQDEWLQEYLRLVLYDEETEKIENYNADSQNEERRRNLAKLKVLIVIF